MGRQNIFSTLSVTSVIPQSMRTELVEFLVNNRQHLLPATQVGESFKTRTPGHDIMSDIVHRLAAAQKDQAYSLIRLPAKTAALHEVVDMTFVPFDLLQLKEVTPSHSKSLSLIPELNDKIIINVTDITKAIGGFSDITQFQLRVVRDFLSRSFYTSSGNVWISPLLVRYVAKVYSMTLGGRIAQMFALSPSIQMFIQSIFAMFFVAKMTTVDLTPGFMKAHARDLGIYNGQDLEQIFAFTQDVLQKKAPESLEEALQVIDAYEHDQLRTRDGSRLTRPVLNVRFASLYNEGRVSTIALEYPPYFLFLILLVLSNRPIGLSIGMKNMKLVQEGRTVIEQVLKSPLFTSGI